MKSLRILHHRTEGLRNDAKMIEEVIKEVIKEVNIEKEEYDEIELIRNEERILEVVEVQIFLEHIYEKCINKGRINIYIPNIEWLNVRDYEITKRNEKIIIFGKTENSIKVLKEHFKNTVIYTRWISKDMYQEDIKEEYSYLHVKGISKYKQSQKLIDTWLEHEEWPLIHIVSYGNENSNGYIEIRKPIQVAKNIILYQYKLEEYELKWLMNKCSHHICPSYSEGWGHYIVEGMSCNKVVITSDLAPMNEHIKEKTRLIKVNKNLIRNVNLGQGAILEKFEIENAIKNQKKEKGNTREEYKKMKEEFRKRIEITFKKILKL